MKADINVTPLIDVLLVLLIVFMLVAPGTPTALDASIPEPSRGPAPPASGLLLAVETGSFAVDGAPVLTLAGLDARLRAALETRRDRTVVVRVAAGVPYARVIDAVDTARGCGAVRVGLVDSTAERP